MMGSRAKQLALFVTRLSWRSNEAELRDYFSKFGNVASVYVQMNKYRGVNTGFAKVEMKEMKAYNSILEQINHVIDETEVNVRSSDRMRQTPTVEATEAAEKQE